MSNELIEQWQDRVQLPRSYVWMALAAIVLLIGLFTTVYTVPAESQAVVQRFGKFVRVADSGLRFKMPFGFEKVSVLPVRRQLKQEFGFGTPGATNPTQYSGEQDLERSLVTGDLNTANRRMDHPIPYRESATLPL